MDLLRLLSAFAVGGTISLIAQVLIDLTKLTPARILVILVCTGVFLGGIGIYGHLFDFAGAGASVPLTGFGNVLAQGTKEKINEIGWLGILTGPLSSGAAGITAAIISGFVVSFIAKPKSK